MRNLKAKRIAAGMSQNQLAEASGVNVRLLQHYEAESASSYRDINKAEAMTVYRLACALGCELRDILEFGEGVVNG